MATALAEFRDEAVTPFHEWLPPSLFERAPYTGGMFGALAVLATAVCLATPVSADRSRVHAGPFVGGLAAGYDDVDGRFSLRVGGMRTASMSSKIPWFLKTAGYKNVSKLVVTGRRLGTRTHWAQTLSGGTNGGGEYVYPSILKPPATGCWRLTFRAGTAVGSLTMLARPRFRG
jgi:hypothetical protein